MFCDVSQGIPLQESGAMKFFVMQSFGIMFEDSLLWILKHFSGQQSLKHNSILRMIGYVWVAAWLVWSSPAWLYPTMRRSKGEPIIPVPSHVENYMRNMLLHVPLRPIDPATNTNLVRLVFLLVSTVLALILVLVGTVAIIQPNILSRNTELSLKEDTPNEGKLKARQSAGILQERSREVVTPWILLFGVKGLALGLILCTLLYMGDLTAAAIVVLMLYVVAVGETYVMSRYGERGSIKKVVIPSLLLLWVGPVFLFLGPKSRESSPERNSK
ncbi:hypothetical protein F4677DRAFT_26512 [Hypoxylon crocopeplum]|nr:hypothetical protein F4677DRAFT_26512 [Hypoxylon crocopeplum]